MKFRDTWLEAELWAIGAVGAILFCSMLLHGCATQRDLNTEVRERKEWSRATDMHRTYINDLEERILKIEKKIFKKRKVTQVANG